MVLLEKNGTVASASVPSPHTAKDTLFRTVVFASIGISILALCFFAVQGYTLMYRDGIAHLEISRRIVDSPTAGLTQLGGVWPPLTHFLSLAFVWWDWAYFSGMAMIVWSMLAYVLTSALLYKSASALTGSRVAGVVAAGVFMLNPNVLYMQSTPMTELPLFAAMMGMLYGVQRWIKTDELRYLGYAGFAALAGSLIRYESWVYLVVMFCVVAFAAWRKGYGAQKTQAVLLLITFTGGVGIAGWMAYNWVTFQNPLNFLNGQYAKPSLWVGTTERSVGNFPISLKTYSFATLDNIMLLGVVLMVVGLVVMLVREKLRMETLPTLALFALFVFFVFALYTGQRPLHVLEVDVDLYNVRFGLLMVLPEALLTGYLTTVLRGRVKRTTRVVISSLLVMVLVVFVTVPSLLAPTKKIATLIDPYDYAQTQPYVQSEEVSTFLRSHYKNGKILMESFGNELVLYQAGIGLGDNIYEGSYKLWRPALKNPSGNDIKWIVMRHTPQPDHVYSELQNSPALDAYTKVFSNDSYYVYEEK